jgi:hypothetical protein
MRKLLLCLAVAMPALLKTGLAADQTHITIHVTNEAGKPVDRAAVIVKFVKGRNLVKPIKTHTSWELRTTQEGNAKIPGVPKGDIRIQIIAKNYQTFGDTFNVEEDERTVEIVLKRPQAQYSAH